MLHKSFRNGKNTVGQYSCTYIKYSQCCMNRSSDVMISEEFLNLARLDIRVSLFFLWRIRELYHIIFKQTNLLRVYVLLARQSTASVNNHYCVLVTYMRMRWWVKDNILTFFGCNLTINRCTGQLRSLAYSQTNFVQTVLPNSAYAIFATTKKNWEAVRLL